MADPCCDKKRLKHHTNSSLKLLNQIGEGYKATSRGRRRCGVYASERCFLLRIKKKKKKAKLKQSQNVWGADELSTISPPLPRTFKDKRSLLLGEEEEVSAASSSGPV